MTSRSRLLLLTLLCSINAMLLHAQPILFHEPLSPRIANYAIDVTLDDERKTLTGREVLTWRNTSPNALRELRFHLYLNAFKNNWSTFMREGGSRHRSFWVSAGGWGWIDITSLKTQEGKDLTQDIEFIHPDDNNEVDQTVIRVPLATPVMPNQTISLFLDFIAKLPRIIARTGYARDFLMVGQWFPKIGVYESVGQRYATVGSWNCHQFHANSEFYADFGNYDVNITLPRKYVVGASGTQWAEHDNGNNTKTVSFHAEDVHDFAWTASPHFVDIKDTWQNVAIRVLMQPQHIHQAKRYLKSVRAALDYFNANVGPYPYSTLTIVDPPSDGIAAGGMEYPTLITVETVWGMPDGVLLPELVTVHEFGHQYWYGMSASNEFEEAWLDEGVNQYYEGRIMAAAYGEQTSYLDLFGLRVGDQEFMRAAYTGLSNPSLAPPATLAWRFPAGSYDVLTYDKTATVLATLERMIGRAAMDSIMKTFFRRWRFRHPSGKDFIATFNEFVPKIHGTTFGGSMDWFFNQTLFGTATCDYELSSIRNVAVPQMIGVIDSAGQRLTRYAKARDHDTVVYRSTVGIARHGDLRLPVDIVVGFENGNEVHETWDGQGSYKELSYVQSSPVIWAKVDPNRKILLDTDINNNSRTVAPPSLPLWKYAVKILFWIQNLIQTVGTIG